MLRNLFNGHWPDAVLFDLDGTLLDSVPDLALAVDRMLAQQGQAAVGVDMVRQWVGNGAQMLVRRAMVAAGLYSHDAVNVVLEAQALQQFRYFYGKLETQHSVLYEGVSETLLALQQARVTMGLVTNKPLEFTQPLLQHFALSGFFELVLGGECLAEKKPHPLPLLMAAERLGAEPSRCVMVGDSMNDIIAAKAAGMKIIAVDYGYHQGVDLSQQGVDACLSALNDLVSDQSVLK